MRTRKTRQLRPNEACIMCSAWTPVKVLWYQAMESGIDSLLASPRLNTEGRTRAGSALFEYYVVNNRSKDPVHQYIKKQI